MINKRTYNKISSRWSGKVYQKWKKLKKRVPMIENNLEFFKDTKVLELGSNAGMYGYILYPHLKKYTGIEVNKSYYKQSLETFSGKSATLINNVFEEVDLSKIDYDLFLASYVLHHLNAVEIEKLNVVFEHAAKVAIHTRSGDPLRYGHDEVGTNPQKRWVESRIRAMLIRCGYSIKPLILCKKDDYNGIYLILAEKV